jgi:Tol biopolymer transport system component
MYESVIVRLVVCAAVAACVLTATTAAAPTQASATAPDRQPSSFVVPGRRAGRVLEQPRPADDRGPLRRRRAVRRSEPRRLQRPVRRSELRNLTADDPEIAHVLPSVSPDGSRIAFLRRAVLDFELVVMAADGSGKRVLAPRANLNQPAWSPDGRVLAFSACCEAGRTRVFVVDADGGPPRSVAEGGASAWSPDGRLAFVGVPFGNPTLFVTDRNGASPRLVAGSVGGPAIAWSPDSRHIAYERSRTDARGVDVAVVSADGGPPVVVVAGRDPE